MITPVFNHLSFLKNLTTQPGVYQMWGEGEEILYIGKAKNLKKRLSNYFQKKHEDLKTRVLIQQIKRIEIILTKNETEALLLENTLIKQHKPKYNVLLRDDKSYPYLFVSQHDFPRLDFHRGSQSMPGYYFGPYLSANAVRENLQLLQKIFKLRNCRDHFFSNRTRPCLQYQMKRCTAPCVAYISKKAYAQDVKNAILFLEGKTETLLKMLSKKMEEASSRLEFELAAYFRNQISALQKLQTQQDVINTKDKEMDVIVIAQIDFLVGVQVMIIRGGRLLGNKTYFPRVPEGTGLEEVIEAFLMQFYLNSQQHLVPPRIMINLDLPGRKELINIFSFQAKEKIRILQRAMGARARLIDIALRNLKQAITLELSDKTNFHHRFERLQRVLKLPNLPKKIACFDISHTQGEETVASYVVFTVEGAQKSEYRRLGIKGITPGDDYAAMRQVIEKRFTALSLDARPDMVLIDGGRGQLRQAERVFQELNIGEISLIGIAKGRERKPGKETLWLSGKPTPFIVEPTDLAFRMIQQVRDEAHRFALVSHRSRFEKKRRTSELERIAGLGPQRRRSLLNYFGGWQEIKRASIEEIKKVKGISRSLAEKIYNELR